MIALDASVLAYAVNRYAPEHARAAEALERVANDERPWGLPVSAVHAFLALVTHPHRVGRPLQSAEALGFLEALLASASGRLLLPTARHVAMVREVLAFLPPGEPAAAALETAVLLREHGVREVLSCDRGLRRFPFLEVRDPVHDAVRSPHAPPERRYRVLRPRAARP